MTSSPSSSADGLLVTGASGYVGKALCRRLDKEGRTYLGCSQSGKAPFQACSIAPDSDYRPLLKDKEAVIHLANRVHIGKEEPGLEAELERVNVSGTAELARQAAEAGVRRFLHVSSILAETSDSPRASLYARSKKAGEEALQNVAEATGLELVILRPPLIYGPNAPGNFRTLAGAVAKGLPLPFASLNNRRGFLYLENLVDALLLCLEHPGAAGRIFTLSDGPAVSTALFTRQLARAQGASARLFPCPKVLLYLAALLTGRLRSYDSLVGDQLAPNDEISRFTGWQPPYTLEQGLVASFATPGEAGQ
ncbi:NAD-dependent epimerase/dehydratase family protein [Rhodovibrionaceae bacterium A322]